MTVYVEHLSQDATTATRSQLWADTAAERHRFTAKLGGPVVAWPQVTTITEPQRRRAILLGAIPVRTRPVPRDVSAGVAA